jgi:hypothetical protein
LNKYFQAQAPLDDLAERLRDGMFKLCPLSREPLDEESFLFGSSSGIMSFFFELPGIEPNFHENLS